MVNTRKRALILIGALFPLLSFFLHPYLFVYGLEPTPFDWWRATIRFLTEPDTQSVADTHLLYLIFGYILYLAYWSLFLLALVQVGFALWTLRSCSSHARKWVRNLAIGCLILSALIFVGGLLSIADDRAFWPGNVTPVSFWDILRNAVSDPAVFGWPLFGVGWMPVFSTLGLALILLCDALDRPQQAVSRITHPMSSTQHMEEKP